MNTKYLYNTSKKVLLTIVLSSSAIIASAQGRWITADLGGGIHSIQHSTIEADPSIGAGFGVTAKYLQLFDPAWGFSAGLGFATYSSKVTINSIESSTAYDNENKQDYYFRTYYNDFVEKQNIMQLEIPIAANYRIERIAPMWDLFINAGVNVGIPIQNKYKLMKGNYETRGFYPSTKVEYADMPQHGFYTTESTKQKGKSKTNAVSAIIFTEVIGQYIYSKTVSFYGGMYIGYSPFNIAKRSNQPLQDANGTYNGVLNSNQIDSSHLLAIGLKIGIMLDYERLFNKQSQRKFNSGGYAR